MGCTSKSRPTRHPGQRDVLVEQLVEAAELVKTAVGCELYIVNTSPTEADAVGITEVWSCQADHDASLSIDGIKAAIARTIPLLASAPERIDTLPVGGNGLVIS